MDCGSSHTQECGYTGEKPDCSAIVERIRSGDPSGIEDLYGIFSKGIRYQLYRQLGPQDLDDKLHDIFVIITQSIQRGDLREPERLMGYLRTVTQRQIAAQIDSNVRCRRDRSIDLDVPLSDRQPTPEAEIIDRENKEVALRVLRGINSHAREVLIRFYLKEEPAERICQEMGLSETQFRLIKSRAKARFIELGKRRLERRKGPCSTNAIPPGMLKRPA
jgi:RNA polymerase sigma-70 factor, ECF subfamily